MFAPVWEGIATQVVLLKHPHMAAFILILLVTYLRPVRASGIEKQRQRLTSWRHYSACWSIVLAAAQIGVSTKTAIRDGSTSSCPYSRREIQRTGIWKLDYPAAAKLFKTATDTFGSNGMTMYQTRHSGASIDRVRGFRTVQEVQRRGQWKAFSSVTRYDKSIRLAADYHSLPRPLRSRLETLAQRAEVLLTEQLQVQRLANA